MSSIHNHGVTTRAHAVLTFCECLARGDPIEFEDDMTDGPFIKKCLEDLLSKLNTLKKQVASEHRWNANFLKMLETSHSIRVRSVQPNTKEALRNKKMHCVACGQYEHCCSRVLDVLGPIEADKWSSSESVPGAWRDFLNQYSKLWAVHHTENDVEEGVLVQQDRGSFAIGSTCLKRALVYFQLNTMLLDRVWNALALMEQADPEQVKANELFTVTDDSVEAFCTLQNQLELVCADIKRHVPDLLIDERVWSNVDCWREAASCGDDDQLAELLRKRADYVLSHCGASEASSPFGRNSEESDGDGEGNSTISNQDQYQGCSDDAAPAKKDTRHLPKRRRSRVVYEDEDEDEDEEWEQEQDDTEEEEEEEEDGGENNPPASSQSRVTRSMTTKRRAACESTARTQPTPRKAKNSREDRAKRWRYDSSAQGAAFVRRPQARRPNDVDAVTIAAQQRNPNARLPSDRIALYRLMEMQIKLMREKRDDDAAVCTESIMVMQRLLARIEQLQHTQE